MNSKQPTKFGHKQTTNKQNVNTQQNLKYRQSKKTIKFCGKQSKRAENVNADLVGVSPNHENRNANDSKRMSKMAHYINTNQLLL